VLSLAYEQGLESLRLRAKVLVVRVNLGPQLRSSVEGSAAHFSRAFRVDASRWAAETRG
jgi:hypothetical protein